MDTKETMPSFTLNYGDLAWVRRHILITLRDDQFVIIKPPKLTSVGVWEVLTSMAIVINPRI